MIRLQHTTQEEWQSIMQNEITLYAEEQIRTGNWAQDDAIDRARAQYAKMLPDGVNTKGHHIYHIVARQTDELVGFIWYEARVNASPPHVFICNLHIFEPFRRRGFAAAAMRALEEHVQREHALNRIQLHVFGQNASARSLYTSVGYQETHVIMAKELEAQS